MNFRVLQVPYSLVYKTTHLGQGLTLELAQRPLFGKKKVWARKKAPLSGLDRADSGMYYMQQ